MGEPTQLVVSLCRHQELLQGEDEDGGLIVSRSAAVEREAGEKVSPSPLLPVSVSLLLRGPPPGGARTETRRKASFELTLCAAVRGTRMRWWDRYKCPLKNVWIGFAARLRMRKSGLLKLRHDVRRCEYDDVHVMWEMLERNEKEIAQSSRRMKKRSFWSIFGWARCAPYLRRSF